jgi:hypothetical protein
MQSTPELQQLIVRHLAARHKGCRPTGAQKHFQIF